VCVLWEGASRQTSYSGVIWDGVLGVNGGRIVGVDDVRFDSPRSHLFDRTEQGLAWHSVACGYPSGIVLELDGDDVEIAVEIESTLISGPRYGGTSYLGSMGISYRPAERIGFTCTLDELNQGPRTVDIGPFNRKVTVSMGPEEGGAESAEFTFVDPDPRPGINPYWVRVVQTDMEMAWTSPIFVDYAGQ
jgi:hypothetical protein